MADATPEKAQPASTAAPAVPAVGGDASSSEGAEGTVGHDAHGDGHDDAEDGHGGARAQKARAKAAAAAGALKNALKSMRSALFSGGLKGLVTGFIKGVFSFPLLLIRGDLATRLLVVGFLASCLLVATTGGELFHRFIPAKWLVSKSKAGEGMTKFLEDEKKIHDMTANMLFLERFSASLDGVASKSGVFEFELYVETDQPRTAGVLRARLTQAREAVSAAIQGRNYDELLSEAGKNALKKDILDAVNRTLEKLGDKGSIKRVYFTRFMMN